MHPNSIAQMVLNFRETKASTGRKKISKKCPYKIIFPFSDHLSEHTKKRLEVGGGKEDEL